MENQKKWLVVIWCQMQLYTIWFLISLVSMKTVNILWICWLIKRLLYKKIRRLLRLRIQMILQLHRILQVHQAVPRVQRHQIVQQVLQTQVRIHQILLRIIRQQDVLIQIPIVPLTIVRQHDIIVLAIAELIDRNLHLPAGRWFFVKKYENYCII